jgi:hypothetical protein
MKRSSIQVGGMGFLVMLCWLAHACGDGEKSPADAAGDLVSMATGDVSTADDVPSIDTAVAWYTCPMHAEILADYAGAQCPKCGMSLVAAAGPPTLPAGAVWYSCPMHPQIQADFAGTCPLCHMALTVSTATDAGQD